MIDNPNILRDARMSRLVFFGLTLSAVASPLHFRAADDKNALDGTWTVVKAEADGKPDGEMLKAKFTFKDGDKLVIKLPNEDKPLEGVAVKLDTAKKPKQIDLTRTVEGRPETATGIYELDGDRLKLCIAEPDVNDRPIAL